METGLSSRQPVNQPASDHPYNRSDSIFAEKAPGLADNTVMPLVRISLRQGKTAEYRQKIGDGVHRAMVEAINVPAQDRFQVITEHTADGLIYDPSYLGIQRTDDVIFVQITLNTGRTVDQKRALYKKITELLEKDPGVRPENVVINLVEVVKENWSFGNGLAPYAT
jgi:4-oxalocrotonate tautomerase